MNEITRLKLIQFFNNSFSYEINSPFWIVKTWQGSGLSSFTTCLFWFKNLSDNLKASFGDHPSVHSLKEPFWYLCNERDCSLIPTTIVWYPDIAHWAHHRLEMVRLKKSDSLSGHLSWIPVQVFNSTMPSNLDYPFNLDIMQ